MEDKSVKQVFDEMSEEQQLAIMLTVEAILGPDNEVKHYGVKGMKWRNKKSKFEKAVELTEETVSLAYDTMEFEKKRREFESDPKNRSGIVALAGALKLGAAKLILNARKTILDVKLGKLPIFSSKITYTHKTIGINNKNN